MAYYGPYFGKPREGESIAFALLYATQAIAAVGGDGSALIIFRDERREEIRDDEDDGIGLVLGLALSRW